MDLKKFKGVWVRPGDAADKPMVNECRKNYVNFKFDDQSRVVDLGCNIGAFAVMCREAGVKFYHAFEANEANFKVATMNVLSEDLSYQYGITHAAVSALKDPTVTFYNRGSKQASCSGTIVPSAIKSNMTPVVVTNIFIDDIINEFQPTHLKIDIEGAEKDILKYWDYVIPSCVQELSLEIHALTYCKKFYESYNKKIQKQFELVRAEPNHGFFNKGSNWEMFDIKSNSVLYGFDLFYRRKDQT